MAAKNPSEMTEAEVQAKLDKLDDLKRQIAENERRGDLAQRVGMVGGYSKGIGIELNKNGLVYEEVDWNDIIDRLEKALEGARWLRDTFRAEKS